MNDNLRELVLETYKQCEKKTYGWQRNPEEFRTKFAELIIEECIRIMKQTEQLPVGVIQAKLVDTHSAVLHKHFFGESENE